MVEDFNSKALIAALTPLGDYLERVVICGSWTLFIYRHWVLRKGDEAPVRTLDVDVAVPKKVPVVKELLSKVLASAGFEAELSGEGKPPVMRFLLKGSPYLEFITPHLGNKEQGTLEVQPGLTAQELRYLEIVLDDPRSVRIPGTKLDVRVVRPAAYLYQKGLSFPRRQKSAKKAKDLAYLFDLLYNLPELRAEAIAEFPMLVRRFPPPWYQMFRDNLTKYFKERNGEGVQLVVSQQPDPYAKLLAEDPTSGRPRFQEAVFAAFSTLLDDLKQALEK